MNLDRMIKNIEQIPPLPVISQKILNVIQDPNASAPVPDHRKRPGLGIENS